MMSILAGLGIVIFPLAEFMSGQLFKVFPEINKLFFIYTNLPLFYRWGDFMQFMELHLASQFWAFST